MLFRSVRVLSSGNYKGLVPALPKTGQPYLVLVFIYSRLFAEKVFPAVTDMNVLVLLHQGDLVLQTIFAENEGLDGSGQLPDLRTEITDLKKIVVFINGYGFPETGDIPLSVLVNLNRVGTRSGNTTAVFFGLRTFDKQNAFSLRFLCGKIKRIKRWKEDGVCGKRIR